MDTFVLGFPGFPFFHASFFFFIQSFSNSDFATMIPATDLNFYFSFLFFFSSFFLFLSFFNSHKIEI